MTILIGVAAVVSVMIQPATSPSVLESLAFLIGEWNAVFDAAPGNQDGPMSGVVRTVWGVERAWIESDFVAESGHPTYAVHILIAADALRGRPVAFAVNTLSPVPVTYEGQRPVPERVLFTGSAAGKWQRVAYQLVDRDHLDFLVEEATAAEGPWRLHSHAKLARRGQGTGSRP